MGDDLERAAPAAVLGIPGAAAETTFDSDTLALAEVLAAELALAVPDADVDEVGTGRPSTAG